MRRDITVPISVVVLVFGAWLGFQVGIPQSITSGSNPWWMPYVSVLMVIAGLRTVILWFQALRHAVRYAPRESREWTLLVLVILGPVVGAWAYYFKTRDPFATGFTQQTEPTISSDTPPNGDS